MFDDELEVLSVLRCESTRLQLGVREIDSLVSPQLLALGLRVRHFDFEPFSRDLRYDATLDISVVESNAIIQFDVNEDILIRTRDVGGSDHVVVIVEFGRFPFHRIFVENEPLAQFQQQLLVLRRKLTDGLSRGLPSIPVQHRTRNQERSVEPLRPASFLLLSNDEEIALLSTRVMEVNDVSFFQLLDPFA
jgi:hypothetical protein